MRNTERLQPSRLWSTYESNSTAQFSPSTEINEELMTNFLYVDNSNLWIEGMYVAAVESGLARDVTSAHEERICDRTWKLDFSKLFAFAGGENVGRAVLFGSNGGKNEALWDAARRSGFEVIDHARNMCNKEKKIDTSIVANMINDSYSLLRKGDEITLVAGDKDYVPAIEMLLPRGISVHVVFWDHAAEELKSLCTKFISLNSYVNLLRRRTAPRIEIPLYHRVGGMGLPSPAAYAAGQ